MTEYGDNIVFGCFENNFTPPNEKNYPPLSKRTFCPELEGYTQVSPEKYLNVKTWVVICSMRRTQYGEKFLVIPIYNNDLLEKLKPLNNVAIIYGNSYYVYRERILSALNKQKYYRTLEYELKETYYYLGGCGQYLQPYPTKFCDDEIILSVCQKLESMNSASSNIFHENFNINLGAKHICFHWYYDLIIMILRVLKKYDMPEDVARIIVCEWLGIYSKFYC